MRGGFLDWLGRRLILVASMTGTATFAGGALGGFLSGTLCRTFTTDDKAGRPELAEAICGAFLGFGTVCLTSAVVVCLVMVAAGRLGSKTSPAEPRPDAGGRLGLVLAVPLIAAVVMTWMAGSPAIHFLGRNFTRLSHGLDGVVLMPPGFVLGTTGTLLFSQLGLLLLLWARSPLFPRVYFPVAIAHLGLIFCNRAMLDAVRSISAPAGSELPLLQVVEMTVATAARGLLWPLIAQAAGLPLLMLEWTRGLFSPRALLRMDQHVMAADGAGRFETPVGSIRLRGASASMDLVELGTRYFVRSVFMAWPVAGRIRLEGLDRAQALTATVIAFRPWPTIEVWLEGPERARVVTIESRHLLGLGNAFDVKDGLTGALLATVKKPFAADWLVHAANGDLAAVVTPTSTGLGMATYVAMIADRPVASFTWSNVLRPSLEIDLSKDEDRWLDRRLGMALGVLVFVNLSFRA